MKVKFLLFVRVFTLILVFFTISCERENFDVGDDVVENSSTSSLTTDNDSKLVANRLRQAALVVAKIVIDQQGKGVVSQGIESGIYSDESIAFFDLFNPDASLAYRTKPSAALFKNKFVEALETGNYFNSQEYGVTSNNPKGDKFDLQGF